MGGWEGMERGGDGTVKAASGRGGLGEGGAREVSDCSCCIIATRNTPPTPLLFLLLLLHRPFRSPAPLICLFPASIRFSRCFLLALPYFITIFTSLFLLVLLYLSFCFPVPRSCVVLLCPQPLLRYQLPSPSSPFYSLP